jgi:hypothetical protein
MIWIEEKEKLERLINVEKKSYEEIGRIYDVCGNTIKKQAIKLGISLKPRRIINPQETFNKGKNKTEIKTIIEENVPENNLQIKNSKNLGEIGERIAIGELAKFGIDVLLPMSDNLPFDFIVFKNNKFFKCQVKTTKSVTEYNSLHFSLTSNNWNKGTEHKYTSDEVDVFICCDLNTIYLFKFDELVGKKDLYLRYSSPKNNQDKGIWFAQEYRISNEIIEKVFK